MKKEADLLKFDEGPPPVSFEEAPIEHVLETVEDVIEFGEYAIRVGDHATKEWMQGAIRRILSDLRYVYEGASALVLLVEDPTCSPSSTSGPSSASKLSSKPTSDTSTSAGRLPSATPSRSPAKLPTPCANGPKKSTDDGCGTKSKPATRR